jgi:nitrile hydratase subunit alpha
MHNPKHHDHDDHDHSQDHDHTPPGDHDGTVSEYEVLERAVRALLIEKGVLSAKDVQAQIELMDSRTPSHGAAVCAKAWTDPPYKRRLLKDGRAALMELGIDLGTLAELKVVESTPKVHNLIVCTLCSCYPKLLMGIPPAWYKSTAYRARAVIDPRGVLAEFGVDIADGVEVRVHDSTADLRYLVLPVRPAGTEGWSEKKLAAIISRDSMIGVAVPDGGGGGSPKSLKASPKKTAAKRSKAA